jgi:transposase
MTFIAGLRHDGMVAPFVIDGAMNGATFLAYIEQGLAPTDFNPIEQAFSKLKALLRKAAERTVPNLQRRIAKLLPCFTATECANFLANAGCAPT